MMRKIENRIVVITGGSSGIGQEIGLAAAKRGALPVLLARSQQKLQQNADDIFQKTGVKAKWYSLDISDTEEVNRVFKQIEQEVGEVGVLINNAGFGVFDYVADADMKDIEDMLKVNVLGSIAAAKAVLPGMLARNNGQIIFIASIAGKLATSKSGGYSASKHAVIGFANALRMELYGKNVLVNTVNPGPVKTAFFDTADKDGTYKNNISKLMMSPQDVAEKTVNLIGKHTRELNLPVWMGIAAAVHQTLPHFAEWVGGNQLRKK